MTTATTEDQDQDIKLRRYEAYFETIDNFNGTIADLDKQIIEAELAVEEQKAILKRVRDLLGDLEDAKEATQKSLLRFLDPKNREELPLFEQMDEADEEVHGANAADWRQEPINALRISPKSMELLNEAGILLVGQLQDKMLDDPNWWKLIHGLNEGIAAAIADGMAEFVNDRTDANRSKKKSGK